jgi:predicted DNA-binding protein YlxM (UPF0122 family)
MRQGKELYTKKYDEVMELFEKGMHPKEIAEKLGISFSAVYAWTKKGKKPSSGAYEEFYNFLKENGPQSLLELKKKFPKHSELFLGARDRGFNIQRKKLSRIMGDYSIWYFLEGQESEAEKKIEEILKRREELRTRIVEKIDLKEMGTGKK